MRRTCCKPSTRSPAGRYRRHEGARCLGLTLIEVAVGLAILSTLLATALVARGRFVRQGADARRRQQAVTAADALLADWWRDPATLPRVGSGALPAEHLRWQTSIVQNAAATSLEGQVVRLEVTDDPSAPVATHDEPLARVELLLPVPKVEASHATQ